jgi:hypothetical protein
MNTTTRTTPKVPMPAGAVEVCDWYVFGGKYDSRYFTGSSWIIEGDADGWHKDAIHVFIHGMQQPIGEVDRLLSAGPLHPDNPITSKQARDAARALVAAADEYDRLSDPKGDDRTMKLVVLCSVLIAAGGGRPTNVLP